MNDKEIEVAVKSAIAALYMNKPKGWRPTPSESARAAIAALDNLRANETSEEITLIKQQHALTLESAESEIEALQAVLTKLVTLKYLKDEQGKTPYYIEQVPIAWAEAKKLVYGKGVE